MGNKAEVIQALETKYGVGKAGNISYGSTDSYKKSVSAASGNVVKQWFSDALKTIEGMQAYNAAHADKYTPDYGGEEASKVSDMLSRAGYVSEYIKSHYQGADFDQWNQALGQYRQALEGLSAHNTQAKNYYSQFKNESEYGWSQKYKGQNAEQLRSAAAGLEDGDEKTWLTSYADSLDYNNSLSFDLAAGEQELQALQARRNEMRSKNHKLWQYEHSGMSMLADYHRRITGTDEYRQLKQEMEAFEQEGGIAGLDAQIALQRERMAKARQIQETARQEQEHTQWLKTVRDPETVGQELETARAQAEQLREAISLDKDNVRTPMGGINMDASNQLQADEAAYQQTLEQIAQLEKEQWWAQNQRYSQLMENPDFEEKSQYVSTRVQGVTPNIAYGLTGFLDAEYDYINRNPEAIGTQTLVDQQNGAYFVGTDRSPLQSMTDAEIKIYNYLYATEGKAAAKEYVNYLQSDLNKRQRGAEETFARQAAGSGFWGGVGASAVSLMMAPMRGIGYLGQAVDLLQDGKIDQNAGYNRSGYVSKAIRDTVSQKIQNNPKWGRVGAFGYQLAMSMVDFLLASKLSGGNGDIVGLIMGTGAAADTVMDAKDRGLSDVQAFSLGTIAGLAEHLTEKYSLETLLDADVLKDSVLKYIRKNMLAEASEEAASSVINLFADILISRNKSEWMQSMQQYRDRGYSKGEAFARVLAQQAAAIGLDALGGAISGGVLGGARAGRFGLQARDAGIMAKTLGVDQQGAQQIIDAGMKAAPDSAAHQVAAQMQSKVSQGETLSNQDVGRLVYADPKTANQVVRANSGTVRLATPQVNVGNTDERWQQAKRLAAITGRNIVFYNGAAAENGYYDNKTGEIYINANGPEAAVQTFSHELTHSTELAEVYQDLQNLAFQKLRSLGQDVSEMRKAKFAQYEKAGHPLASDKEANAEIVADFVAQYLLTDEQTIFDVVANSPTLGQRILRWIDGVLAKLGNENAKERVFLDNARGIYSRAIEQTRGRNRQPEKKAVSESDTGVQQSGQQATAQTAQDEEEAAAIQEITEAYEVGELDETLYKTIVDNIRQEYAERRASERQYSFAGENAKTADLQALRRAKEMQSQGVADETIRQQTGWFRGMDGKWRFEIDDSGMKYHRAGDARFSQMHEDYARHQELTGRLLEGEISQQEMAELRELNEIWGQERGRLNRRVTDGNAILQNLIQHDALFEAYPELRGVKVRFENLNRNELGHFYPNANLIILSSSLRDAPQSTILHEVQHAIQRAEGFATGSSREYWDQRLTAGDNPHTRGMTEAWQRLDAFEEDPANAEVMDMIRRLEDAEEDDTYKALEREAEQRGLMDRIREHEQLEMEYYSQESRSFNMMPSELYENTAGEIEARDVSQRRAMDAEARKKSPPNLGDDRTVFAGRQYSLQQDAEQMASEKAASKVRDGLNRKATEYLIRMENRFVRRLGEQLGIPRYAQYDIVRPVIQQITDEFLQTGKISDETIRKAFDTAYDQGKVIDREFYDQYKEVRDYLRTTGVTLSQSDKSNIPDYNQWVKSVFGSLRVVNEGGLPVDSAYQELQEMAPELFPARITHPADQLMRMAEVSKQIRKVEKSLDEYYGPEADTFRSWARHDFGAKLGDMMPDLRTVKRYAEQQQREEATRPRLQNAEEAQQAFNDRKRALIEKERARAKNLLSDSDNKLLKQLLDGTITLEELTGRDANVKGIREVYEATREYEAIDRQIRQYQAELREQRQEDADKYLGSSLFWRDKATGFAYKRETMRRNILDIVSNKRDAYALLRNYFEPVQKMEAERQRFLNEWRDKVRAMKLSTDPAKGDEVSEAYAVQLYGEAITSIEMIQNSNGRITERDGRDLDDWQGLILDMYEHSPNLDRAKIENAVKEFRSMYDDLFQRMNTVLIENGYPPVDYRKGYFPHFQGQEDGVAARFGRLLGINFLDDVLPTTINGMTHKFRPGKQWFAHAQERTGFQTTYDAVEGFDRYIEGVSNVIYHTENIQKLRALAKQIRFRSSDEGIREQVQKIRDDEQMSEFEKEKRIEEIYEKGRFALSNFVRELDEYTNILAGKKSMADRSVEHWLSRRFYTWIKYLEGQVGANMVGGNLTSALTNFIPLTQAWGQLDTTNLLAGMRDTLMAMKQSDGFSASSDFLTRRKGSEKLTQTWIQKASAKASLPMELIDGFTSEAIVRGAYYQNIKKGMSEDEALRQADLFAANVMADRSKGALPTIFEMRNPVAKIFTQFQTEVNNQMSEVFKDLPRAAREKTSREIVAMVFKYFFGAWLFNEIYELLIGRRPALDPINMAWEAVEDWQKDGLFVAGQNLADNVIENLPFVSGIAGGGRVPMASALPDVGNVWEALSAKPYDEEEKTGMAMRKRLNVLGTELAKPVMLLSFPFAGNQVMKAWKGAKTVLQGGSYNMTNSGEKQLQYAVDTSDPFSLFGKLLMASVMGKSALPEARAWTDANFNTFKPYQTAVYDDLVEAGVEAQDAWNLVDGLRSASDADARRRLISEAKVSEEAKAIAYYGMAANDKDRELMDKLTDLGASAGEAGSIARALRDADPLPDAEQLEAEAKALRESHLTEEEKREVVTHIFGKTELLTDTGNPTEYAKFLTATEGGLSVDSYMAMRAKGASIDDYFEFIDAGVSSEKAADLLLQIKDLQPAAGYKEVSYIQRAQIVLDSDLSQLQKLDALKAVPGMYESTYEKIRLGYDMGISPQTYLNLRKAMSAYDANDDGKYNQKETRAAIDATLPYLTNEQKAVLWQMQDKSWKSAKSNPYDRETAQKVIDYFAANSSTSEDVSYDDPYALMKALSIIP